MSISSVKTGLIKDDFLVGNTAYDPSTFFLIQRTTVGAGGVASVSFTSIPSTYKHLQIRIMARDNRATNTQSNINMTFNSDTGTNYSNHDIWGNGTSALVDGFASQTSAFACRITGATAAANLFGGGYVDINDYASTTKYKTTRGLSGTDQNGSGGIFLASNAWLNTAAITRIDLVGVGTTIQQNSTFALYGMKG